MTMSIVTKLATGHESDCDTFHPRKTIRRFLEEEPSGLWTRKVLEDVDNNWLIAIARRHPDILEKTKECCLILVRQLVLGFRITALRIVFPFGQLSHLFLQCGGGYDILLLLNDAPVPEDVSKIPRISVSTCVATSSGTGDFNEQDPVDQYGAICPTDSLPAQVVGTMQPVSDCRIYLDSTCHDTFGSILGGQLANKRIVRCHLNPQWVLLRSSVENVDEEHAHVFHNSQGDGNSAAPAPAEETADGSDQEAAKDRQIGELQCFMDGVISDSTSHRIFCSFPNPQNSIQKRCLFWGELTLGI